MVASVLGVGLFISGLVVMRWFFRTMRRNNAPVAYRAQESTLVTDGPFRYSRNPMYLAIVLFHAGLACLVNALGFVLVLPVHRLVMQYEVIRHEERHLDRVFGEEYRAYKARVRRWLWVESKSRRMVAEGVKEIMTDQRSLAQANKTLVREYLTEVLTSNGDRLANYLTDDHIQRGPAPYQEFSGRDACWEYADSLLRAFPDLAYSVIDVIAIGDHVLVNFMVHGTHAGNLVLGDTVFAPTGEEATWKHTALYHIVNGKIAETEIKNRHGQPHATARD